MKEVLSLMETKKYRPIILPYLKTMVKHLPLKPPKTDILILSGEPLNETIVPHGPFVMNTKEEIHQAFDDYNNGKFGFLED